MLTTFLYQQVSQEISDKETKDKDKNTPDT